jgi:hypothetical protein
MAEENDQQSNVATDKKNGKGKKGELHQLPPVDLKPGQKAKVREVRPPAEAPKTWPAPEVEAIAARLINGKYPHMSVLRGARIAFLFSNAEREGDLDVAKVQRFSSTYSFLFPDGGVPQFVVRVSKPQWDRIPEDLQLQCVYSYLLRMGTDSNGRWTIERPDVIGFLAELEVFKGLPAWWNKGFARAKQLGLFDGLATAELVDDQRQPAHI